MLNEAKPISENGLKVLKSYDSYDKFALVANPVFLKKYQGLNNLESLKTNSIKIREIAEIYGKQNAKSYIEIQLTYSQRGLSANKKMTPEMFDFCAEALYDEGMYMLNIAEMTIFFNELSKGSYGQIYAQVEAVDVLSYFRQFLQKRLRALNELNNENKTTSTAEFIMQAIKQNPNFAAKADFLDSKYDITKEDRR